MDFESTKSRRRATVGVFAVAVMLLAGALLFGRRPSGTFGPAASASVDEAEQVLERLAVRNAHEVQKLREQTLAAKLDHEHRSGTGAVVGRNVRGHRPETIQEFRKLAWLVHEERRMLNRTALQEQEFERVMQDPATFALALDVATDLDAAREIYGDEQALMRTYAVRSLSYSAMHGRSDAVGGAVDAIGKKLNDSEKWEKGIQHDYVELAASYLRSLGPMALLSDPDALWQHIHLSERTSVEVGRALYDSGLLHGLSEGDRQKLSSSYDNYIAALQQ